MIKKIFIPFIIGNDIYVEIVDIRNINELPNITDSPFISFRKEMCKAIGENSPAKMVKSAMKFETDLKERYGIQSEIYASRVIYDRSNPIFRPVTIVDRKVLGAGGNIHTLLCFATKDCSTINEQTVGLIMSSFDEIMGIRSLGTKNDPYTKFLDNFCSNFNIKSGLNVFWVVQTIFG